MAIDLKNLSPKELEMLIANASAQLGNARSELIKSTRQKIEALLHSNGLTIDEVYPTRGKKGAASVGKSGSAAPKYRNPEDPSVTWSGRGREPEWFKKALKRRGVTKESLLIGGGAPAPAKKRSGPVKKVARKVAKRVPRKTK
ncbi:H-NS histone family protein (plasmid) [Dyella sp. BiH032]|uniref:H-NS histone family protein n=1 Tax=Dyella sp. BiH032 TaxID=3075430 RepID=UPI0028937B49|nr:H-NS histone family protein [Dyella sp. BiH032]WNL48359.1 H-NS histone family protein [Dyella sp. BiH032]